MLSFSVGYVCIVCCGGFEMNMMAGLMALKKVPEFSDENKFTGYKCPEQRQKEEETRIEIDRLILEGKKNREIAAELCIKKSIVEARKSIVRPKMKHQTQQLIETMENLVLDGDDFKYTLNDMAKILGVSASSVNRYVARTDKISFGDDYGFRRKLKKAE